MDLPDGYLLIDTESLELPQLEQVAGLHLRSPQEWGDKSYDDPDLRGRMARGWHKTRDTGALFIPAVVDADDHVRAFIWAALEARGTEAHIHSLFIDHALRRRGIALALKAMLEAWAIKAGAACIVTDVHTDNAPMRALNARLGYADTTIRQVKPLPPSPRPLTPEPQT